MSVDPPRGCVEADYFGRLANRMAQYCLGRILATELGFDLRADPLPGFPNTISWGMRGPGLPVEPLINRHRIDLPGILSDRRPRRIVLKGLYLRYEYYRPHKEVIRRDWLAGPSAHESFGQDDLTIHIRAGDVWQSGCKGVVHPEYHALPFSFYAFIIKRHPWRQITVVTEDARDPMVQALVRRQNARVLSGSPQQDFARLRASTNIVLSVSSFAWWAAWLSDARRILLPGGGPVRSRPRAQAPVRGPAELVGPRRTQVRGHQADHPVDGGRLARDRSGP